MPPPAIRQLEHVALPVSNLEASCRFYADVLGLSPLPRPEFPFPGAWFRLGAAQELHLIAAATGAVPGSSRGVHFALAVDDAARASAHLAALGIPHRGPGRRPDGAWQVFLADPDGHVIELCQPAQAQ